MAKETPRALLNTLAVRARDTLSRDQVDPEARELGLRILDRAERAMGHLESAARTLEGVAKLELALLRKMAPVVEDLSELVRHTLNDARQKRGLAPREVPGDEVIEVESTED